MIKENKNKQNVQVDVLTVNVEYFTWLPISRFQTSRVLIFAVFGTRENKNHFRHAKIRTKRKIEQSKKLGSRENMKSFGPAKIRTT